MTRQPSTTIRDYKRGTNFGSIGIEIVVCLAVGFFGGRYLDGKLGTTPWLSIIGFIVGVGAAIKGIHRAYVQMQAIARMEEREEGNPKPNYEDRERRPPPDERHLD